MNNFTIFLHLIFSVHGWLETIIIHKNTSLHRTSEMSLTPSPLIYYYIHYFEVAKFFALKFKRGMVDEVHTVTALLGG